MINTNVQHIFGEGAIAISLTGMSIVFSGLILISIFIGLLPRILDRITLFQKSNPTDSNLQESKKTRAQNEEETNNEIASAIALVLQLESQRQHFLSNSTDSHNIFGHPGNLRSSPRRLYA